MRTIIRNKEEWEQSIDNEVVENIMNLSAVFTLLGSRRICDERIHTADVIWRSGMSIEDILNSEHVPKDVKSVVRGYDAISKIIESSYESVFDPYVEGTLNERMTKTPIPDEVADRHVEAYIDFISSGVSSLIHMRWILRCLERNKELQKHFFKRMAYISIGMSEGEGLEDIIEIARSRHGRSWTNIYAVADLMSEMFSTGKISVLTGAQKDENDMIIIDEIDKHYRVFEARYRKLLLLSRDDIPIMESELRLRGKKIAKKIKEDMERKERERKENEELIESILKHVKMSLAKDVSA